MIHEGLLSTSAAAVHANVRAFAMPFRLLRLLAIAAALGLTAAAAARSGPRWLLLLGAAEAAVLAFAGHLLSRELERRVAVRYLRSERGPGRARRGLWLALGLLVTGLALFGAGHGRDRVVETVGAFATFAGAIAVALAILLSLFSVFMAVSTLGVALGVASLVLVLAVTSGFEREFQDKVLSVNGHVIVTSYGLPEPDVAAQEAAEMASKLADLPGLLKVERFSLSPGEVMIGRVGANLKGVDLSQGATDLARALVAGRIEALGEPAECQPPPLVPGEPPGPPQWAGRIVLGNELARKLRADVGDCVRVLVPFWQGEERLPPSYWFKVVGRFHFGFNEYDTRLAYVNIEDASRLSEARRSVFGVEARFSDPMAALRLVDEIETRMGHAFKVIDWRTLNANLFTALAMQKVAISIVLLIIIVVAAFNILASLYLIVLAKVREIAILSAMGARRGSIVGIFLCAGAVVGGAGGGLGLALGLTLCSLVARFGYSLDPKVYLIERLPVALSSVEILLVPAVAMAISLIATLYPAVRASRLRTVDGLRYD